MSSSQQLTSRALHSRINADVTQLLQRFENIMAAATVDNTSHTSTAIETYQLDVESTALVRAAEDILTLTRTMKEAWLFGRPEATSDDQGDAERQETVGKNVKAVKDMVEKLGLLGSVASNGKA